MICTACIRSSNSLYLFNPFCSLRISNAENMGQSNSAFVVDTLDEIEQLETNSSSSPRSPGFQVSLHLALYFFCSMQKHVSFRLTRQ